MEHFVVYEIASGLALYRGSGYEGIAGTQKLEPGEAIMLVPSQALASPREINLDVIKASYCASVDQDADKVRSMFITNTPGQMATYLEKEAEARRVLAGDTSSTLFLSTEAAALDRPISDLAAEVIGQADQWRPIGARIEAARRKTKVALTAATNLTALAEAIKIDWPAVVAG
jgi:hypothetical protein